MIRLVAAVLGVALSNQASAHYVFGRLILNGTWTKTWEYVREVSPVSGQYYQYTGDAITAPLGDPTHSDLRCGRNATTAWSHPQTAVIHSGDTVGFACGEPSLQNAVGSRVMFHPGFATAFLSRAEDGNLDEYEGDGDWFKILQVSGRTEQSVNFSDPYFSQFRASDGEQWGTYWASSWNFTIPESTPSGKYLLRFEHVSPHAHKIPGSLVPQWYVNCAHIEVVNTGHVVGSPGPMVKIPGVYRDGQPEVYFDTSPPTNMSAYVPPGPKVWSG